MVTDTTQAAPDKPQAQVDEPQPQPTPSPVSKEPSPDKTPTTYTQEQVDRLLEADRRESGRARKAAELERDGFKSQLQTKEKELTRIQEELSGLEKRIEELSSNDPELNNLEKRAKQLREQERTIKTERDTLDADKETHSEKITLAENTLREIAVWEIANQFEGGDPVKLKSLCDTFEAKTEEQMTKIAETLWAKKGADATPNPEAPKPAKPYSGMTSGGVGFTPDKKNPDATLQQGFREANKK